jgi:hypothetical protein
MSLGEPNAASQGGVTVLLHLLTFKHVRKKRCCDVFKICLLQGFLDLVFLAVIGTILFAATANPKPESAMWAGPGGNWKWMLVFRVCGTTEFYLFIYSSFELYFHR